MASSLPLTIDVAFPGLNAKQGQYTGAPSAGLKGTASSYNNSVSPEAGYAAGLATNVNGRQPFYGPNSTYGPTAYKTNPNIDPKTNQLKTNTQQTTTQQKSTPTPQKAPSGDWEAQQMGYGGIADYNLQKSLADERQRQIDMASQISDAYAPALAALDQAMGVVNEGANSQTDSINRNYDSSFANANTELDTLNRQTGQRQSDFNQTLKSAYDQAIRAYNALQQKAQAKYGGGSSAGAAYGELANQEFYRQQGNVQSEGVKGEREFANEFSNISNYIAQKKTDLDNWKKDAIGQIQQNLKQSLLDISMRRGDIEANKTKDKIAALNSAVQNVQNLQNANTQFLQQLALNSVGQMQQVSGRAFSPTEIKAVLQQWGVPLMGTVSTQVSTPQIIGNRGNNDKDQFSGLTGI